MPHLGLKKYLWFRFPDRPYYFLPTLLFFSTRLTVRPSLAGRTACQNGVCCHNYWTKLPKFVHRNYTSLVNILTSGLYWKSPSKKPPKAWKKYSKKKFRPTYPNFFRDMKQEPHCRHFFRPLLQTFANLQCLVRGFDILVKN